LLKTIELDDRFGIAHLFLGATYTEQSRFADAQSELEAALRHSGRSPEIVAQLGYLFGVSGQVDAARTALEELRQLALQRYVSPARLAQVHVGLGEGRNALDRLEEAHAEHAADMAWIGVRPVFAALRSEPRFATLLKQMALPTG
jgi:Flp pilus assembly protein TadD